MPKSTLHRPDVSQLFKTWHVYRRGKFLKLLRVVCLHTYGFLRVHGELSRSFKTFSGFREKVSTPSIPVQRRRGHGNRNCFRKFSGCLIRVARSCVIWIMQIRLFNSEKLHKISQTLSGGQELHSTCFGPRKCKLLLQNWTAVVTNSIMDGKEPKTVNRFINLGTCMSKDGTSAVEVSMRLTLD